MHWRVMFNRVLLSLIFAFFCVYRWVLSPLIHSIAGSGFGCRFEPVCSEYSRQAFARYGFWKGFWFTFRRISRCHPFGGSGYDPIPVISAISNENLSSHFGMARSLPREAEQR